MTQRNRQLVRVLRLVAMLRERAVDLATLAESLGVSTRTIRRDLAALQEVYTPVAEVSGDDDDTEVLRSRRVRYRIIGPARFAA